MCTVRGLTVNWKQTIAFYYSHNAASSADLERMITVIVVASGSNHLFLRYHTSETIFCGKYACNMQIGKSPITPYIMS